MRMVRPELKKGLGVLGLFIVLIVVNSLLQPIPYSQSKYTFVDLDIVRDNPTVFYDQNISSTTTVESVWYLRPNFYISTPEEMFLSIRRDAWDPPMIVPGDRIYIRGTVHNRTVFLHEFYVLNYSSSIIRSVPGIILFGVIFFQIFTIDFKRLAFVPRRRDDA